MKKVIVINEKVIFLSDYDGKELKKHHKEISNLISNTEIVSGDLYEYDERYVDNKKYVGGWALIDVQDDMINIDYDELKGYFLQAFEVSHLAFDMLDYMQELNEDDARTFVINKFNQEFTQIQIAKILYNIK